MSRAIATTFEAEADQVAHAIALTDVFRVAEALKEDGPAGLTRIQLQPLVPIRPALAMQGTEEITDFPVWVERKYDGIRLMLHKSTGARGSQLFAAFTRRRGDWIEQVPGIDVGLRMLGCQSAIIDGELFGTTLTHEGVSPATVYDVYASLQGDRRARVNLKYAAFDLLHVDGFDLTQLPLAERRQRLIQLVQPVVPFQVPVPFVIAEGQLAESHDDVNRLYAYFRNQGYEGIIAKDLTRPYVLAARDPTWTKRKPAITVDLVLLAGVFSVTRKESGPTFGSYVLGAKTKDGSFLDVGDVAAGDRQKELDIQAEIMREGLLTGKRIERASMSGTRPGVELTPHVVVTIKVNELVKDRTSGKLHLRDPKLLHVRSDKSPNESDTTDGLEELFLRQRIA